LKYALAEQGDFKTTTIDEEKGALEAVDMLRESRRVLLPIVVQKGNTPATRKHEPNWCIRRHATRTPVGVPPLAMATPRACLIVAHIALLFHHPRLFVRTLSIGHGESIPPVAFAAPTD